MENRLFENYIKEMEEDDTRLPTKVVPSHRKGNSRNFASFSKVS